MDWGAAWGDGFGCRTAFGGPALLEDPRAAGVPSGARFAGAEGIADPALRAWADRAATSQARGARALARAALARLLLVDYGLPPGPERAAALFEASAIASELGLRMPPALLRMVERDFPRLYESARRQALDAIADGGERPARPLPEDCPYGVWDIVAPPPFRDAATTRPFGA